MVQNNEGKIEVLKFTLFHFKYVIIVVIVVIVTNR